MDPRLADVIIQAASEVMEGKWNSQFVVDPYQAGAGTSHNMNMNEVIANRATMLLGGKPGEYLVHPNDHVNFSQSTNDTIPTAIRLGCLWMMQDLVENIALLVRRLKTKSQEFDGIVKSGRTHLQDAIPIRLGQEFEGYAGSVEEDLKRIKRSGETLRRLGIGGTAIGTSLNAHPDYPRLMVKTLAEITGFELTLSDNLFESTQSMADPLDFSASMRTLAVTLTRIANDLRLLSSGPNTGFNEIHLPALQAGSSIMPGKVNPAIPEMVNMSMYQVIGLDTTIMLAVQAGQLELNVMMPVIAHNLFWMIEIMNNSIRSFSELCIKGLTANPQKIRKWLVSNPIIITALNPIIGYEMGAKIVNDAKKSGKAVIDIALEMARQGLLFDQTTGSLVSESTVARLLSDLAWMTEGGLGDRNPRF